MSSGCSVAAILYGGLTALAQTDLKKLVAYSSVATWAFATLGIFALNKLGIEGAVLVMINHGVTTGALFIVVGIIYERLHTRDLAEAAGIGKTMPIFALFAGVFALSSLAFPGTNSFIGEFLVMSGGFKLALTNPTFMVMMICVVPGVVLAAAYMLRMLQKVAYGGTNNPDHSNSSKTWGCARSHPHAAAGVRLLDRPPSRTLYPRARRQREHICSNKPSRRQPTPPLSMRSCL
jgi:NADH-quinone oxidoreductase subunit M